MNLFKVPSKLQWVIIGIAGIIFFVAVILFVTFSLSVQNSYAKSAYVQGQVNSGLRLLIPNLKINAPIEEVGLTPDGAMNVPSGPSSTGWYNLGPRPGEEGSAVIDGHSGWKNGIPAVFDNLYKLKKGDKIFIQDKKGEVITFIVLEIRSYDPNAGAEDVFSSNDGKAHLNLITCGGAWDNKKKTHSKRLIVFSDQEIK